MAKCKLAAELLQYFDHYEKNGLYKLLLVGSFTLSCLREVCCIGKKADYSQLFSCKPQVEQYSSVYEMKNEVKVYVCK